MSGSTGGHRAEPAAVPEEAVLDGQPPPAAVPDGWAVRVHDSLRGRAVVALDDDPTGTQVVHGVPVAARWEPSDLDWLLAHPSPLKFVLTNSRSLGRAAARARTEEVARGLFAAAARRGVQLELVSRSDSTLRGHFPDETDVLAEVAAEHGQAPDVLLLCPAFPEAGRITVAGVHWVGGPDGYRPAAATEYARDAAFGYRSSSLPAWVAERSGGRVPADRVRVLGLPEVRTGGPDRVAEVLAAGPPGACVAADAAVRGDLEVLAAGVALAREAGVRCLHRCGPSLVGPLAGVPLRAPLASDELAPAGAGRGQGLVVVGSHTALSTRQLELALAAHDLAHVELDVAAVLADAAAEVARVAARMEQERARRDVVVSTSRLRRDGADAEGSLDVSRAVSRALVAVVRRLDPSRPPRYVVAKGGITSSDVATEALGVRRAVVLGQMVVGGLPVWRLPEGSACPGAPYVIFPGNVGAEGTLADVLGTLRGTGTRPGPVS